MRARLALLLALLVLLPALPAGAATPYRWTSRSVDSALARRMHYSYRPGCPVPLRNLRYVTVTYLGFDAKPHTGELVVNADAVTAVVRAFARIYGTHLPVHRMRLADDYRGDDKASMAADNTSAFNCRRVDGSSSWSQHAYGRAVDVNPVENPYVHSGTVEPAAGRPYVRRSPYRKGMVTRAVIDGFAAQGWGWGGTFRGTPDYQHFSRSGT